jgi:hypothetical protein
MLAPAALRTAVTLRSTCVVCSATVVPTTPPVSGPKGSDLQDGALADALGQRRRQ